MARKLNERKRKVLHSYLSIVYGLSTRHEEYMKASSGGYLGELFQMDLDIDEETRF